MKIGSESLPSSISVNHNIRNLEFLPKAISTFQQDYYDTMCLTLHHHRILIISAWEFPRNSLLGNFSRGLFKRGSLTNLQQKKKEWESFTQSFCENYVNLYFGAKIQNKNYSDNNLNFGAKIETSYEIVIKNLNF